MGDPVEVLLHGRLAAILDTGPSALSSNESVQFTPYIARLSAAWEREPSLAALYLWLDACLPENGARRAFEERATALKLDLGLPVTVSPPVDLVWANTDAEYPGAVSFQRSNAPDRDPRESGYVRLSSEEIAVRLEEASRRAAPHPKGQPRTFPERRSSLSGVRGKIGLTLATDGTWQAATGNALNTWIAKHEHNHKLPGEAGIEAICQRTLANLGLPAARTLSHVFAGEQAVLSERADRHADPATRSIRPRHQEEFCQATAWPGALKYDQGRAAEPRWEHAYTLLRNHAPDPDRAQMNLTAILAATWGLGHVDLHRRNLGFTHSAPDEPFAIDIAPMYDVSSGVGVERTIYFRLAIGIARQRTPSDVGPVQWLEHARRCALDPIATIAIVSDCLERLPDAFASARRQARDEDENIEQAAVDRRADELNVYTAKRAREWTGNLGRLQQANARGLNAHAAAIAAELRRLDQSHGEGTVQIEVQANGPTHLTHIDPQDATGRRAGTTGSTRTLAEALILAGKRPPYDVPELERTLDRERANELAIARTGPN